MKYAPALSDQDLAAFEEVAEIHDRAKFLARLTEIIAQEVAHARNSAGNPTSFRAASRWKPTADQLQRGRALMLKEFRQPGNLTIAQFAALAGKSRQQIYKDVRAGRLLTLSIGTRGQHIPDWQLEEIKKRLTQGLLEAAQGVDEWTLYYALIEPNRDFAGKRPIEAVTPKSLKRVLDTLLGQLGFHV